MQQAGQRDGARRILIYGVTGSGKTTLAGSEACNGNRESLRNMFSRDSIIVWHFKSFDRKRQRIRGWAENPIAPPVTRLRSPRQAERWLDEVRTGAIRL